jgi:TolA-binding protein
MEVRSMEKSQDCDYLCYCDKHVKEMERKAQRIANGESSTATTPAKTPAKVEEAPKEDTPPPTPKIEEDTAPVSAQKESGASPFIGRDQATTIDYPMKELRMRFENSYSTYSTSPISPPRTWTV